MKKLFSVVLLALATFALAACDAEETPYDGFIEVRVGEGDTQTTIDIGFIEADEKSLLELLEEHLDVEVETTDFGPYLIGIGHLEAGENSYIAFYKNDAFASEGVGTIGYQDGDVFSFMIEVILDNLKITLQNGLRESMVYATFDASESPTLLEVISSVLEVETSESDWGIMLEGIGFIDPPEGSFIAIYHNGEYAMEGIEMTAFDDGDAFTFRLEWWDDEAYANHYVAMMYSLTGWYIGDYAQDKVDKLNPFVIAGLYHIDALSFITAPSIELDEEPTATELFNAIIAGRVFGEDVDDWVADLGSKVSVTHAYSASLFAMALGEQFYTDELHPFLTGLDLANQDIDTLALIALAASLYDDEAMRDASMDTLLDILYTHPYGNNGASFALAMIATESVLGNRASFGELVEDEDGFSLAVRLLAHARETGLFYWKIGDDNVDTFFTTPQAFLAMAMVISEADHPFSFLIED